MQHGVCQDNLLLSREKVMATFTHVRKDRILNSYLLNIYVSPNQDGEHDNRNQLLIPQNSSPSQDPVSGSMPDVIFMCF
jgi:hypothetical protein